MCVKYYKAAGWRGRWRDLFSKLDVYIRADVSDEDFSTFSPQWFRKSFRSVFV